MGKAAKPRRIFSAAVSRLADCHRSASSIFSICPCLVLVLWLIAGILPVLLPAGADLSPRGSAALLGSALAVAFLFTPSRRAWLALLPLLAGLGLSWWHLNAPRQRELDRLARSSRLFELQVVATDSVYGAEELEWLAGKRGYTVRASCIRPVGSEQWLSVSAPLLLALPEATALEYGSRLSATGHFEVPSGALVPGEFDYRKFLRSRGIKWVFRAGKWSVDEPAGGWRAAGRRLYRVRDRLAAILGRRIGDRTRASLLLAMTLGYREGVDPAIRRSFIRSGIVHIFAISGLHVGIMAAFMLALGKLARLPFAWRYWTLPVFLGFYVLMTGAGPSAVRAWIMISLWAVAKAALLPMLPLNAVAAAALLILLVNPLKILDLGFQFSFVIVLILIAGWQAGLEAVAALRELDLWVPRRVRSRSRRCLGRLQKTIAALLGGSLLAWLASLGIVLYTQGLFIPGAILLNLMVAITAWMALSLAMVKLVLSLLFFWMPSATWLCDQAMTRCLGFLQWLAELGAERPFSFAMSRPWLAMVLVYYGLLLAALTGCRGRLRGWSRLAVGGLAPLLLCGHCLVRQVRQGPAMAVFWGGRTETPVLAIDPNDGLPPIVINSGDYWMGQSVGVWLRNRGWEDTETVILTGKRWEQVAGLHNLTAESRLRTLVLPVDWESSNLLRQPVAAGQRHGVRLRLYSTRAIRQSPQSIVRQACLAVEFEIGGRQENLRLQRRPPGHPATAVEYLYAPLRGATIKVQFGDLPPTEMTTAFSREPQWRQIALAGER